MSGRRRNDRWANRQATHFPGMGTLGLQYDYNDRIPRPRMRWPDAEQEKQLNEAASRYEQTQRQIRYNTTTGTGSIRRTTNQGTLEGDRWETLYHPKIDPSGKYGRFDRPVM